ncbi:MAG: CRISPR-associated endonuclease Cas2 [Patescibacteria group bacterium]|nr:CRISPR-associated endonuclease Cas2 [Patescibacteria group bacterium]
MRKDKIHRVKIAPLVIEYLSEIADMMPEPFETPYAWIRRAGHIERRRYYRSVKQLKKRGFLEITKKQNKQFLKLTRKGQLSALFARAKIKKSQTWDGKWRLVMFDIPEAHRKSRRQLRLLLKKQGFVNLQESVFISPFPINRAAIEYLHTTGLVHYIRILRVDEMDEEKELLRRFKLK